MHFICAINDIEEGTSKGFTIGEQAIFVVKKDDVLHAYHNRCPHLGIELEYQEDQFLDSEGALIQCSTHGALFLIDSGHCVSGPCQGDNLTIVATKIEAGSLYLINATQ